MKINIGIQILRAIAALSVVWYHIYDSDVGFQGVQLFFCISGYIFAKDISSKCNSPIEFLKRRVIRIYPAYLCWTVIFMLASNPKHYEVSKILRSLSFTTLSPINPVGWTLTYEAFFYLLIAVIVTIRPLSHLGKTIATLIVLVILDITLWRMHSVREYSYGNYFIYFAAGVVSYHIAKNLLYVKEHFVSRMFIVLGVISIGILFFGHRILTDYNIRIPGNQLQVLLIPATLSVIFFSIIDFEERKKGSGYFVVKMLKAIGDASYTTYLSHLILIEFMTVIIGEHKILIFIMVSVLTQLIYLATEKPFMRMLSK